MCAGSAEISFGELGVELDSLGSILYRETMLFKFEFACCTVTVERGDRRVECDGEAVLMFGSFILTNNEELVSFILEGFRLGLSFFDRKSDVFLGW